MFLEKKTKYKKSIVCFIDILGFKEFVHDENNISAFATILGSVNQLNQFDLPSMHLKDMRFTSFSDSIVVSVPCKKAAFGKIIRTMAVISHILLEDKILFRGALTCGSLFHENNIVFGPALVEAYLLEESAVYPRIVMKEETLNACLKTCGVCDQELYPKRFHQDEDGLLSYDYLYDYFKFFYHQDAEHFEALINSLKHIKGFLRQEEIKEYPSNIMMKYRWMKSYYNRTLDKLGEYETFDTASYKLV